MSQWISGTEINNFYRIMWLAAILVNKDFINILVAE
jgi:hypothetical protein